MVQAKRVDELRHIWVVNQYAALPSKDARADRPLSVAKHMMKHGWSTSLIVASTTHPSGRQMMGGRASSSLQEELGVATLWLRSVSYVGSPVRRIIGMVFFTVLAVLPSTTRRLERPDAVLGSTVHPLAAWAGWRLARRLGVPYIFEMRDVWPDALVHLGRLRENGLAARLIRHQLVSLAKRAALVVSPLPGLSTWLAENGLNGQAFAWVPNGIEADDAPEYEAATAHDGFTVMYLGSHGNANALEGLIAGFDEAVRVSGRSDLRLRLVGDGPRKNDAIRFADACQSREFIGFEDRIPRHEVVPRAREADCLLINLHDHDVYRFGVSPNKIFDYLLSGRPIVFATNAPNNPVRDAEAGIVVPADDAAGIARAILDLADCETDARNGMGLRGYRHVIARYNYESIASNFAAALDEVVAKESR